MHQYSPIMFIFEGIFGLALFVSLIIYQLAHDKNKKAQKISLIFVMIFAVICAFFVIGHMAMTGGNNPSAFPS